MPIVEIRLARRDQPTSREQKAEIAQGITELLHRVLDKRPESVVVLFDERSPDDWAEGGVLVTELRQRRGQPPGG